MVIHDGIKSVSVIYVMDTMNPPHVDRMTQSGSFNSHASAVKRQHVARDERSCSIADEPIFAIFTT